MKSKKTVWIVAIIILVIVIFGAGLFKKDAGYIFTSSGVAKMYCDGVGGLLYYKGNAATSTDWCVLNPRSCPNTCKDEGYTLNIYSCGGQPVVEPTCTGGCTNTYTCTQGTLQRCGAVISTNCFDTGFDGTCKKSSGDYASYSAAQLGLCNGCSSTNTLICSGGDVYNYNECSGRGSMVQDCSNGCTNGVCNGPVDGTSCTAANGCPGSYLSGVCDTDYQKCTDGTCQYVCTGSGTCVESDAGQDYYTKGTVTVNGVVETDSCSTSSILLEWLCTSSTTKGTTTSDCPNGCSNGACIISACNCAQATNYCAGHIFANTCGAMSCTGSKVCELGYDCVNNECVSKKNSFYCKNNIIYELELTIDKKVVNCPTNQVCINSTLLDTTKTQNADLQKALCKTTGEVCAVGLIECSDGTCKSTCTDNETETQIDYKCGFLKENSPGCKDWNYVIIAIIVFIAALIIKSVGK